MFVRCLCLRAPPLALCLLLNASRVAACLRCLTQDQQAA